MLDRFGCRVLVAWKPHELLWLEAAILDGRDGIKQLAELTGRTFSACASKAYDRGFSVRLRRKIREPRIRPRADRPVKRPKVPLEPPKQALSAPSKPAPAIPRPIPSQPPVSTLRPLTKAQLMTGGIHRRVSVETVSL